MSHECPVDHPRQLALMHAPIRFAHVAAGGTFTTADLDAPAVAALGVAPATYPLAPLRDDLANLWGRGFVEKDGIA